MPFAHAIVWIDHRSARIIAFSRDHHGVTVIADVDPSRQVHRKSGVVGSGHASPRGAFLEDVADALIGIDEIIVSGPGVAKTAFERHVAAHRPDVAAHIVAVESSDHPTDGQLLAHARTAFRRIDQLGA
jgi:stalled ribosome rescue protein Dom34